MINSRAMIYFIYDHEGIIDRYIIEALKSMKPFCSKIIIVVNGLLQDDSYNKLSKISDEIIIRENAGFDVWAYKSVIDKFGWDYFTSYDELIIMNYTLMGPIYDVKAIFEKMDKKQVDFWGLTLFHNVPFDPFCAIRYGYIPMHIQSSFIVYRKQFMQSKDLQEFWDKMPPINSYIDSIANYESIFTKNFEDLGYKWDVYVDTRDDINYTYYPLLHNPLKTLTEYKSPFFKRRSFFHNYNDYLEYSNGNQAKELYDFIKDETDYDTDMIWENIIRTCSLSDIYHCMNLNYISCQTIKQNKYKAGLFVYIENETYLNGLNKYLNTTLEDIDINIITSNNVDINKLMCNYKKHYQLQDLGIYSWLSLEEDIMNYDVICFIHNKPMEHAYINIKGDKFLDINYQYLLRNQNYILKLFEENKFLGIVIPQDIYLGEYFKNIHHIMSDEEYNKIIDFKNTIKLSNYNISRDFDLILSSGMFWCRTKSLQDIFSLFSNENYEFIKYLMPLLIQKNGYVTGKIGDIESVQTDILSYQYMINNIINSLSSKLDANTSYNGLINNINNLNNMLNKNKISKLCNFIKKIIKN